MDDGTRVSPIVEAFLRLARAGDAEKCESTLRAKADLIDSCEAGGFTALHFAASHGHKALMLCLLQHKPAIDKTNYDGHTALMLAARHGQKEMAEMLLDAGANVNCATSKGVTAMHQACKMAHQDILRLLVRRGGKLVTETPVEQGTVLHWAADGGNLAMMGFLVYECKIPIDVPDAHGGTPLFSALIAKQVEAAQFCLDHGASHKAVAVGGTTPLHIATGACPLDAVKLLMDFGADPNARDDDGDTPLSIAEKEGKRNFVAALSRAQVSDPAKRAEQANHFKESGNKHFGDGENNKALKFYSLAIALQPTNHVFFSNRSAANFNAMQYVSGLNDALRCVALKPDWPKGYLRLAGHLKALKRLDEAVDAVKAGLKLDAANADLKTMLDEIMKTMGIVPGAAQ